MYSSAFSFLYVLTYYYFHTNTHIKKRKNQPEYSIRSLFSVEIFFHPLRSAYYWQNYFFSCLLNCNFLFKRTPLGLNRRVLAIHLVKVKKTGQNVKYKGNMRLGGKKGLGRTFSRSSEPKYMEDLYMHHSLVFSLQIQNSY